MNREIKFRAWRENKMHYNITTAHYEHNAMSGSGGDLWDFAEWMKWSKVMQYTGLKDKNGVEIYEGDILERIYDVSCFKLKNGEILEGCEPGNFMVKKSVLSEVKWSGIGFDLGVKIQIGWHKKNTLKVIGNIFENPELLK